MQIGLDFHGSKHGGLANPELDRIMEVWYALDRRESVHSGHGTIHVDGTHVHVTIFTQGLCQIMTKLKIACQMWRKDRKW